MEERIFEELEYIYSRPNYNRTSLENEILIRCSGDGTIYKKVLELVKEYREQRDLIV